MPLIEVKVIEGVFTNAKKQEMITKLMEAMIAVEGENLRPATMVIVEEVRSGDWSIGGRSMTTADVHAMGKGKAA